MIDTDRAGPGAERMKAILAPVAAGALGIVLAVVGGSVLTASDGPAPRMAPEAALSAPPDAAAADLVPAEASPAEAAPAPPGPGGGLPGVQYDQPPPGAVKMGMEIVVKFKNDALVKDIIDAFWRDQASARAKFEAWKAGRPAFSRLKLDRVTYSNELVLIHDGEGPAEARLPFMREIAKKLGSLADVSYAEPNMTAQPGGQ